MLTTPDTQAILDACDQLRDRFLLAVLYESGVGVAKRSVCVVDVGHHDSGVVPSRAAALGTVVRS